MSVHRRGFFMGAVASATAAGLAKAAEGDAPIPLWPGAPPGGPGPASPETVAPNGGVAHVVTPRMAVYRPANPTGAAVLILGGGGYGHIAIGRESEPVARWLNGIGVTAFVLVYRLPRDTWPMAAPFQDAQRAMRIIRARAATLGVDPKRVGILGFSAGGHLAGMTAVRPNAQLYAPVDAADTLSARPDFAGLIYPALTLMPPFETKITTRVLLGDAPTMQKRAAFSVERLVGTDTPPTFLAQAADDPIAPIENSLFMFAALRQVRVPAALHVFQTGGHGFALGTPNGESQAWPRLFATWAGLG